MLVNVANEINEERRERCNELVHVPVCKEEETVNDEEGKYPITVAAHGTA